LNVSRIVTIAVDIIGGIFVGGVAMSMLEFPYNVVWAIGLAWMWCGCPIVIWTANQKEKEREVKKL